MPKPLGAGQPEELPALPLDEILAPHQTRIDQIRLCYGLDRRAFELEILPLIRAYAAFVHLLPATPTRYFREAGGLLKMGLEIAFFALQGSDAHIFSGRSTISVRHQQEPRWRKAIFTAGLCSEVHRALNGLQASVDGKAWPAYMQPLTPWLQEIGATRFYVTWASEQEENRPLALLVLPHIIPPALLQDLADGNGHMVGHVLASIAGLPAGRADNPIAGLIKHALALVTDAETRRLGSDHPPLDPSPHMAYLLMGVMHQLLRSHPGWRVNAPRSRIFFGADGLFLLWPQATDEIRQWLDHERWPGIPREPEILLEILVNAGILTPHSTTESTWPITPPESKRPATAVKFAPPGLLVNCLEPRPGPLPQVLADSMQTPSKPAQPLKTSAGQLELSFQAPSPQEQAVPPSCQPTLNASLRLPRALRNALDEIVGKLLRDERLQDAADGGDLFIPLSEFSRHGLEAAWALRTLRQAEMLLIPENQPGPVIQRMIAGNSTMGVILSGSYLDRSAESVVYDVHAPL